MNGWTGKILDVDLSSGQISSIDTKDYTNLFLGGIGIGEKLYWDKAKINASAFDPENPLIIMTGPLTGTNAPSSPRAVICGKSPCLFPEAFSHASIGGIFPYELKRAGFDGIVIEGKSEKPVYIDIQDERAEIRIAPHLWGRTNSETRTILKSESGEKTSIISIGPAAENLVRISTIFTDLAGSASMGYGAVMGSKNLKAIAVKGTGKVNTAHPDRIKTIREKISQMTGKGYHDIRETPIILPGTKVVKKTHCMGCPRGCNRSLQKRESGAEDIRKCQTGMFYYSWDTRLHGKSTDASFSAATIANDYSICVMEIVHILLWLDGCIEKGILGEKETGLPLSKMGSIEFFEAIVKMISSRHGFGNILAEGALRASREFGSQSREITARRLTSTGRAIAYGPRVFSKSAMIYAVEPRPFITELHEISEPFTKWALWHASSGEKSYVSTQVLRKIGKRFWGSEESVNSATTDGKALATVTIQNRQYAKESLILCDFAWPLYDDVTAEDRVGDPSLESRLFSAVTGVETDEGELLKAGERIFNLNRAIFLREGRKGKEEDILPDFIFDEKLEKSPDGFGMRNPELLLPAKGDKVISRRGKTLCRSDFQKIRDEYYELRQWDVETGYLKKESLKGLGLGDVIDELKDKSL